VTVARPWRARRPELGMPKLLARFAVALGVGLLTALPSSGQEPAAPDRSRAEPLPVARGDAARVAGWRADLDSLVDLVRTKHWRFREAPLPKELTDRALRLRAG